MSALLLSAAALMAPALADDAAPWGANGRPAEFTP